MFSDKTTICIYQVLPRYIIVCISSGISYDLKRMRTLFTSNHSSIFGFQINFICQSFDYQITLL